MILYNNILEVFNNIFIYIVHIMLYLLVF